jgi:hypothetical protein
MVDNERSWEAVVSFSESVMSQKMAAERVRKADAHADPIHRKWLGGRRRRLGLLLPIDSAQNSAGSRHGGISKDPGATPTRQPWDIPNGFSG